MKKFFIHMGATILLACALPIVWSNTNPEIGVQQALSTAAANWNKGDLTAYLKVYAPSPKTIYVTDKIIHGFPQIERNVWQRFPNRQVMGRLSFSRVHIKVLSSQYALAIGRYQLVRRRDGIVSGYFTTLFQRTPAGWQIIVDHSS